MTYAQSTTRDGYYMLPASTKKGLLVSNGSYLENQTSYQGCREFSSESVLKFDDDAPQEALAETKRAQVASLRPGTKIQLALTSKIDLEADSAGDLIEATLIDSIRNPAGNVVAAAGTVVRGHLTQVERRYLPKREARVGIRFDRILLSGSEIPLTLVPVGARNERDRGIFTFRQDPVVLGKKFVSRWIVHATPEQPK